MKCQNRHLWWRCGLLILAVSVSLSLFSCAKADSETETTTDTESSTKAVTTTAADALSSFSGLQVSYEEIPALTADTFLTFSGTTIEVQGEGASVKDNQVTITKGGVYSLGGTLTNGRIVINSEDSNKVYLLLNGVNITSQTTAPLYVINAKRTILYLEDGTENTFSDTADGETAKTEDGTASTAENEVELPNATIYSKDKLVIAGEGNLTVNGNGNNGITGKDWIQILGGNLTLTAQNHGIKGKDYLAINGADTTVTANGDGLKSTNNTDEGMGFVLIENGTVNVEAKGDGISAETKVYLSGGEIQVTAGDATKVTSTPVQNNTFSDNRWGNAPADTSSATSTEDEVSMKGIKAGTSLTVTGGKITVNAVSHGLHSAEEMSFTGGSVNVTSSNAKGISAHGNLTVDGEADVTVVSAGTEGVESKADFTVNGGSLRVLRCGDDGINTGGTDTSTHQMTFNGGYVYVYTEVGDGLDSNASITFAGGTVIVIGSNNGGNSCIDTESNITYTGGTVLGIGASSSMWQDMSSLSGECMFNTSVGNGTSSFAVKDSSGNVLVYVNRSFDCAIGAIFLTDRTSLDQCAFVVGATLNGEENSDGVATAGTIQGGTEVSSTNTISGGMGGNMGGMGGMGGPGGMR